MAVMDSLGLDMLEANYANRNSNHKITKITRLYTCYINWACDLLNFVVYMYPSDHVKGYH